MGTKLWVDGGRRYIAYVLDRPGEEPLSGVIPLPDTPTGNQAEYIALTYALKLVSIELGIRDIAIFSDSQLMVRQLAGEYSTRSKSLTMLHELAAKWLKQFDSISLTWIPREQNKAGRLLEEYGKKEKNNG